MGFTVITDWQVQRRGTDILLGLAVENAVLDVLSDYATLSSCLTLLETPRDALETKRMGRFGTFDVSLNVDQDDLVSLFVDGPSFEPDRCMSAALWVGKEALRRVLREVLKTTDAERAQPPITGGGG